MKPSTILPLGLGAVVAAGLLIWWSGGQRPERQQPVTMPASTNHPTIRIGVVPEHDVFSLRRSYLQMTKYLEAKMGKKVELRTLSSYEAVLLDFRDKELEAGFMGSLVAGLAMDRLGARAMAVPVSPDGVKTYRGVMFVRDDSPIRTLDHLEGRSIGMVKATLAGSLFPVLELKKRGLLDGPRAPRIVWLGTHDEVLQEVAAGRLNAGAAKDLRLAALERQHPGWKLRRLAESAPVPNNTFVVRGDVAENLGRELASVLLRMESDPDAREALRAINAARFVACQRSDFDALFEMAGDVGEAWPRLGVPGPAPRPSTRPATRAMN